jgi:gliding motility-associated-like protein
MVIGWNGTFNGNPLPSDDYWYLQNYRRQKPMLQLKEITY